MKLDLFALDQRQASEVRSAPQVARSETEPIHLLAILGDVLVGMLGDSRHPARLRALDRRGTAEREPPLGDAEPGQARRSCQPLGCTSHVVSG